MLLSMYMTAKCNHVRDRTSLLLPLLRQGSERERRGYAVPGAPAFTSRNSMKPSRASSA